MIRFVRFVLFALTLGVAVPCMTGCSGDSADDAATDEFGEAPDMDEVPEVAE
jgi:hypothetical protein